MSTENCFISVFHVTVGNWRQCSGDCGVACGVKAGSYDQPFHGLMESSLQECKLNSRKTQFDFPPLLLEYWEWKEGSFWVQADWLMHNVFMFSVVGGTRGYVAGGCQFPHWQQPHHHHHQQQQQRHHQRHHAACGHWIPRALGTGHR